MQTQPPEGAKHTDSLLTVEGPAYVKGNDSQAFSLISDKGMCVAHVIFNVPGGDDLEESRADAHRLADCWNACDEMGDPVYEIQGFHRQLEAWETSAKLRDDGLCPTQREVIADQQAQIERLEALRDELVTALKVVLNLFTCNECDGNHGASGTCEACDTARENARAVIAKAEGGAA